MTQHIQASHRLTDLDSELRQAQVAAMLARERARDAARQPAAPAEPKPRAAPKPAAEPARAAATKPEARKAAKPSPEPALPPGSMILSAGEAQAVDHLLSWYEATHPTPRRTP